MRSPRRTLKEVTWNGSTLLSPLGSLVPAEPSEAELRRRESLPE